MTNSLLIHRLPRPSNDNVTVMYEVAEPLSAVRSRGVILRAAPSKPATNQYSFPGDFLRFNRIHRQFCSSYKR